ncbi:MAG: hypothetical protein JWL90_3277 [Chthoniobacteraceae bacterium]|nr:hypothetical protein [Chthoniobacteraceae bacterium]
MEIREFAEQVLFTSSLEEKLLTGDLLTDEEPGSAILHPGAPGRPANLQMQRGGGRAPFPGAHRLMDETQRGVLLHFFANHELLATELMALVLLKFPEAPKAFRRGIVRTLREEQEHTRWYLKRMAECGVQFGDLPLNRFFWDAVAPMETPLDYVTRLSLTFEQANLDYARHYSQLMADAGDAQTAALLERIYRDEIAHVGYGLSWFRRWKEARESDWEAYRRQLHFPLSPSRARGNVPFNSEGRLCAGLTEEFIREIKHFGQSKGRTPNVFWFNPNAEAAIAAERAEIKFHPRASIAALARDLEILPAFLSRRDDVVLMVDPPPIEERARLHGFGFALPEFEGLDPRGTVCKTSTLRQRKLNGLRPWAWSPESAALFAPLIKNCPGGEQTMEEFWSPDRALLFSKEWALARRRELLEAAPHPWIDPATAGGVCLSITEVEESLATLRCEGPTAIALKAPLGMSGQKNRRLLADEPLDESVRHWAQRIISTQGALIVEPWLERVHDFSIQYEMDQEKLALVALVHLFNDARGQFLACECGPRFGQALPPGVGRFLMEGSSPIRLYDGVIRRTLESGLHGAGYRGPVGVDAFVYRAKNGDLHLQPIVEVNPRYTMGRLTFELLRRVAPRCSVRFELVNVARCEQADCRTLYEYAEMLAASVPPRIDAAGRLCAGSLILNRADKASQALAVLTVKPFILP